MAMLVSRRVTEEQKNTVLSDQGFDDILSSEASIWMALEEVTKTCYIYMLFAGAGCTCLQFNTS